jgi:7-cyano-7-deazaguanine synthase
MKLNWKSAMVVFSGGQDSTTCLGHALKHYDEVHAVSFDYGQKHARELQAAADVIDFFHSRGHKIASHETVFLSADAFAGTSPLTNRHEELETYENHDQMEKIIGDRVEKTFVPMRNAVFLMLAANRAVVKNCATLITGVCQADNANYPDCRDIFVRSAEETINRALGTAAGIFKIDTPLMNLSKAESIKLAQTLPDTYDALAYSHTAYDGSYPPTSKDHASVLRAHGFEEAGVPDPLVMRAWRDGLMGLPGTANYDAHRAKDF